jgi:hypothetical protein
LAVLILVGLLAASGLAMVIWPTGFGRFAHELRISIPAQTPATDRVARAMGCLVLAAAAVVLIVWA